MRFSPVIFASVLAVAAAAASAILLIRHYLSRSDHEQRRRALISLRGRIIEGYVLDVQDGIVIYSWSWRGVDYEASQDVRTLRHLLPAPEESLIGPATVKFLPRDPSNSIIAAETWNGFHSVRDSARE